MLLQVSTCLINEVEEESSQWGAEAAAERPKLICLSFLLFVLNSNQNNDER